MQLEDQGGYVYTFYGLLTLSTSFRIFCALNADGSDSIIRVSEEIGNLLVPAREQERDLWILKKCGKRCGRALKK